MRRAVVGLIAAALVAGPLQAQQNPVAANCAVTPSRPITPYNLCRKVVDMFTFLSPQVGVAVSGGNVMLGEGGTLGGPKKFSLSLHVTAVDGRVPSIAVPLSPAATEIADNFGSQRMPVPMPSLDAAIGVFKGIPAGLTNVGGVDLLLGATYVPNVERNLIQLSTEGGALALSYGIRLGLLQESVIVPGVGVSFRRRKLPTVNFVYGTSDDTISVKGASITSDAIRFSVAKHFLFVGVAAGLGRDVIQAKGEFSAVLNDAPPVGRSTIAIPGAANKVTRSTAFVNVSFGIPKAQLVLEAGWSSKGEKLATVNTFGGHSANEGYRYGSIGFGFRP